MPSISRAARSSCGLRLLIGVGSLDYLVRLLSSRVNQPGFLNKYPILYEELNLRVLPRIFMSE
jgi:hypothetical protein